MSAIPIVVAAIIAAQPGASTPTPAQWAACNESSNEKRIEACTIIADNQQFRLHTRAYAAATIGDIHLEGRRLALAIDGFSRAIRLSPDYAYAYRRRAFVHFLEDRNEAALSDYSTAIDLSPLDPYAFVARASFYRQTDRADLARPDIERALKLDLDNSDLYYERGLLSLDVRDFEQAELDFLKTLSLSPGDHDARYHLANTLRYQSRVSDALKQIGLYIDNVADDPQGFRLRGWLYVDLGETDKAIGDFEHALAMLPDDLKLRYGLGFAHWRHGDFQVALQHYQLAEPDYDQSGYFYYERGYARYMLNQDRLALDDANRALELDTNDVDAMWLRGAALLYLKEYPLALDILNKAAKARPDDTDILVMRGRAHIAAEQYIAAIGDLSRVIELKPDHSSAAAYRAYAAGLTGQTGLAGKTLDGIIAAKPDNALALELAARLYYVNEEYATARSYSDRLIELVPGDAGYLALHGDVVLELGEFADAAQSYRSAIAIADEPSADWLRIAAYSAFKADDRDNAFRFLQQARLTDPEDSWTNGMLGDFWIQRSEFDKAVVAFDDALVGASDDSDLFSYRFRKAKALAGAGDRRNALEALTLLAKEQPDNTDVSWERAGVLLALGRSDEALVEFEQFRRRRPASLEAHYRIIEILSAKGRHAEALKLADRVVYMEADKVAGHRTRGQIYADMADFRAAAADLRQAVALSPQSIDLQLLLARFLIDDNDAAAALTVLQDVLTLDRRRAEAYYLQAMAYKISGRAELALQALARAKALDDGHLSPQIASLRDRLR